MDDKSQKSEVKICPFCGDPLDDYSNDGHAHYDCARDYEIYESMKKQDD